MKKNKNIFWGALISVLVFAGCSKYEGTVHTPAYIHLDSICVSNNPTNSLSNQAGFFTSNIDAVQLELWFEGDRVTTQLGTYTLPCTVPVLDNRPIQKIQVYPFVKLNGIAATRGYYPFYEFAVQQNIPLTTDSVINLGKLDTNTGRYYYNIHYQKGINILKQEFFEPIQFSIIFDSIMDWVKHDNTLSATGDGCGHVHINKENADTSTITTSYIQENNPSAYLYLELEYKSTTEVAVGMRSTQTLGSNENTQGVMNLYPTDTWTKMYINLGKTWKWFNHNPFKIVFTLLNTEEKDADFYVDNLKIISY